MNRHITEHRLLAVAAASIITIGVLSTTACTGTSTGAPSSPACAKDEVQGSAFCQVTVELDSGVHTVSWESTEDEVSVVASTNPDSSDGGKVVASGGASETIEVRDLDPDKRWFFHLSTTQGDSVVAAWQSLGIETIPNGRDLGGLRTADGEWVKQGVLLRTGVLDDAAGASADLEKLSAYDIAHVVDFRGSSEVKEHPDPDLNGAANHNFPSFIEGDPVVTESLPDASSEDGKRTDEEFLQIIGYAPGWFLSMNQELSGTPTAVNSYRQFFEVLLEADGEPVLWHCTSGQDRTGWAAYVLLTLLGVPDEVAVQNYLDTNVFNDEELASYGEYFESLGFTPEESDFFLKEEYIHAARTAAETTYGSWDAYVENGLGLSDEDIEKLRDAYLSS